MFDLRKIPSASLAALRLRSLSRFALLRPGTMLFAVLLTIPTVYRLPARSNRHGAKPSRQALEVKSESPISGELAGGGSQTFTVTLAAKKYFRVSVNKGDALFSLAISGPPGELLMESTDHRLAILEAAAVAATPGTYQVTLRSLETDPAARRFELKFERALAADARDLADIRALRAFAEGDSLSSEWTADSLHQAANKFKQASLAWQDVRPSRSIDALRRVADLKFMFGEYDQAIELNKSAAAASERIGDRSRNFDSQIALAQIYSLLGMNVAAQKYLTAVLDYCDQIVKPGRSAFDNDLVASAHHARGQVYYALGNPNKALEHSKLALKFWTEAGSRRGQAQAQLYIGYELSNLGDQAASLVQFHLARDLYRNVGDQRGQALCLTALGALSSLQGNEQAALNSHLEALRTFRTVGDPQSEGVALNGAAQALGDLGQPQTALDNYEQALKLFKQHRNLDFATATEYRIAKTYRAIGDIQNALLHYERCLELGRAAGKIRLQAYALKDLAELYESRGKKRETLLQYQKVIALYRGARDLRGQAITLKSIGDLYFSLADNKRALDSYKKALQLVRTAGDRETEIAILLARSRACRAAGLLEEGLAEIEQSIKGIEALRSFVISPELRSSFFTTVSQHYELYITLLMNLNKQYPGRGYDARALSASESARARALVEILAEAAAEVRQGMDPKKIERVRVLQQELLTKERYQAQLGSEDQAEAAQVAKEIRELTAAEQVLQGEMREENPRYGALVQPQPFSLREIQAALHNEDTLLLEYSLGETQSFLWAVSQDSFNSYELPNRSTIEQTAHKLYDLLTTRQQTGDKDTYQKRVADADAEYLATATALSKMLLGPVADRLGQRRLLIIADGVLQYIPFEALPAPSLEGKQAAGAAEQPLVVSDHEVVNLPSSSVLRFLRLERTAGTAAQKGVAVFADPVFTTSDPRLAKGAGNQPESKSQAELAVALRSFDGFDKGEAIPRLPQTLVEAQGILDLVPSRQSLLATGFGANRSTVLSPEVGEYQIVHFATHGLINNERPRLSGIVLSMVNRDGESEDGFLRFADIYNLNLRAKLVVLSACNTALGKDVKGEGLVGLTRGFMYAGSKSVVASLWKVDDRATAELMRRFYSAMLVDNQPPAAALRSAKESLRREKRWSAPYYWAGFVLQGEYREPVHIARARAGFTYIIVGAIVVLACLVGGLYLARRRHRISLTQLN